MLMLVQLYSWCYAIVADAVVVATVDIATSVYLGCCSGV
jgi:hypothetical protein